MCCWPSCGTYVGVSRLHESQQSKGRTARKKGLRILPWAVYKHAKAILPDVIIMENVEEIQQWGPLDEAGHPIKERAGEDYKRFIATMKKLGYDFDSETGSGRLRSADNTAAVVCNLSERRKPITWPEPTHNKGGTDGLKKWEPIWKCLDLQDMGKSIFGRKKPLAEKL